MENVKHYSVCIAVIIIGSIMLGYGFASSQYNSKMREYVQACDKAEVVMEIADSIVDVNNTGTLDNPDDVTANYWSKRCDFQDVYNKIER